MDKNVQDALNANKHRDYPRDAYHYLFDLLF